MRALYGAAGRWQGRYCGILAICRNILYQFEIVFRKGDEMADDSETPLGELALRTLAMPADTNPSGDIFGGWLLAQMDLAGGMVAHHRARGRVATVAINSMVFHQPVKVGDTVCCYAHLEKVGRTSMTYRVQAWIIREAGGDRVKVTEGLFTYVAIGTDGRPRPVEGKL
jgi:acyl-CoA thioesterase YciA